jgi:hypothetical protein
MPCYRLEIRLSGNLPILVMGLGKVNFTVLSAQLLQYLFDRHPQLHLIQ